MDRPMPYMIYEQYKTEVKRAYRGSEKLDELYAQAKSYREWLEALQIDERIRNSMVESVQAIEEAFRELIRNP
jgi:hypothetical protein